MKKMIIAALLLGAATGAIAQTAVSISIGQPGFYGRIDLGDFRQPPVVYAQPIIIERSVRYVAEPVYLRVPPGHMKKWSKHCHRYDACGRRVYFVRDDWYNNTYAPRYRDSHGGGGHQMSHDDHDDHGGKGKDKGHGKGKDKDKGHGKHKD